MVQASSQQEFSDADWRAVSSGDQSKKLKFDVSGVAANTTRAWTVPDKDITVMSSAGDTMTGGLTIATSGATPLTLERTGAATNVSGEFKNTSGSVFAGHGAANTFAVKGDANLASSPWFWANAVTAGLPFGAHSLTATIADDAVADFGDVAPGSVVLIFFWPLGSSASWDVFAVRVRTNSSPICTLTPTFGDQTFLSAVTTNVTGTSGTDGRITVSATNGHLKVENRRGSTVIFGALIMRVT